MVRIVTKERDQWKDLYDAMGARIEAERDEAIARAEKAEANLAAMTPRLDRFYAQHADRMKLLEAVVDAARNYCDPSNEMPRTYPVLCAALAALDAAGGGTCPRCGAVSGDKLRGVAGRFRCEQCNAGFDVPDGGG